MHCGKQNRISIEPKFDGRGVPGETYNQLGCDSMDKSTVRAVGRRVRIGDFCTMRVTASYIHRIQGNCLHILSHHINNISKLQSV